MLYSYIYIYMCVYVYSTCIYIYVYINRLQEIICLVDILMKIMYPSPSQIKIF
jgi:hypothetical protein